MPKIWNILKKIIFAWGAVSICSFLLLAIWALVASRTGDTTVQRKDEIIYEKKSDGIRLTVTRAGGDGDDDILIGLEKEGRTIVKNYHLPVRKYGIEWLQVSYSKIIPAGENEYRIILYSSTESDDETNEYIWFLKYGAKMNVVQMIGMEGMPKVDDQDSTILGIRHVYLPYAEGFGHGHFAIPIEVRVGESIQISPLLDQHGLELMKKAFDRESAQRRKGLGKDHLPEQQEQYEKAAKSFNEAIAEISVPY